MHIYIYVYNITGYFFGYKCLSMADFGLISVQFLKICPFENKLTISRKNLPLHVFMFKTCCVCPGTSAFFPGNSPLFKENSTQKNRHIFTQRRVRSAQEVGNTKLTTVVKKWPFQVLHKISAQRAEILQKEHYVCPFEDPVCMFVYK